MTDLRVLTAEQANAVWDVLVEHAGADDEEWARNDFVSTAVAGDLTEWRFQGWLGFGGKFYLERDRWRVSAYPEDLARVPSRRGAIEVTNAALDGLRASYTALAAAVTDEDQ